MDQSTIASLCYDIQRDQAYWSEHVVNRIYETTRPARRDVEYMICEDAAAIIERTLEDDRGPSCLIRGEAADGRILHVKFSYPPFPTVITAYWPDTEPDEWDELFWRRVQRGEPYR